MGRTSESRSILLDLRPLRENPAYRRLWWGLGVSNFGTQLTVVAVGLQVYDITASTLSVGVLGLFALVPLVALGLYGGALVDQYDRRRVALIASSALWLVSIALAVQALQQVNSVILLYVLVALQSAGFAINNPARSAIIPRLLPRALMPSANVLQTMIVNIAMTVGPLLGAVLVALVMDSVAVELSFMIGPALGVLAATFWSTSISLLVFELLSVVGGLVLWLLDPPLKHADVVAADASEAKISFRVWISPLVVTILAATAVATVVLTGTDVGVIAALRDMGQQSSIGWVLAIWGAGSAVGGLIYGAMKRTLSAFSLLALLGLTTIPVALSPNPVVMSVLLFVSGMFCAPTITATIDHLSRVVPARVR